MGYSCATSSVRFRVRCNNFDTTTMAIRGEFADWITDVSPTRVTRDGAEFCLSLPVGVYEYKCTDGTRWALDEANPRTRGKDGVRNNLLVVDGATEPLLFAPALPFLQRQGDGALLVVCGIRRSSGETLRLVYAEDRDGDERVAAMSLLVREDEHDIMWARLPMEQRGSLRFEWPGGSSERFIVQPSDLDSSAAWFETAHVYTIFVDRFRRLGSGPFGADPGPDRPAHGDLPGITASLEALRSLGVTCVYLTPVTCAASCHRYDLVDPLSVDPALGGEDALRALLAEASRFGIRVLLDVAFTHAGSGFPPYEDVKSRGRDSPYRDWFLWDASGTSLRMYGTRTDAPLLNLRHPEVVALALSHVEWLATIGVSAIRIDAVAEVPMALACRMRDTFQRLRPDGVVLGEVVPEHAALWHKMSAVDVSTDFAFHRAANVWLAQGQGGARGFAEALARSTTSRGVPIQHSLRFLSTHDHVRMATLARASGREAACPLALFLLLMGEGIPCLLYGEELGLSSEVADLVPETVWRDRMPMPWPPAESAQQLRALVAGFFRARAESPALSRGSTTVAYAEGETLVMRRMWGDSVVDVVIHAGTSEVSVELSCDEFPAMRVIASVGTHRLSHERLTLGPYSGAAVLRSVSKGPRRTTHNRESLAEDFSSLRASPKSLPTRFAFSLTERCNLRCRHCITHAPERTASRAARTMKPWLVGRLAPYLGDADYFSFVHGGESLTSPMLWTLLEAIRESRGSEPYTVHLLSNGVLLTPANVSRLLSLGVHSISVSLDGGTAPTNDSIREGGKFSTIVANLRRLTELRREGGIDLRLGISCVVMPENAAELDVLVDLAAALSVDWVKLEELVPSTPFAKRSLLSGGSHALAHAVDAAIQRGRGHGLVMVDHTRLRVARPCETPTDADLRAFGEADDFANRCAIHPCRGPWDTACIEPNGDVLLGDFHTATLGNLMHESLPSLWSGARARSERERAASTLICARTMVCVR